MVLATANVANSISTSRSGFMNRWNNDSSSLESRDWGQAIYAQKAAQLAYRQAGINNPLEVVDFAEVDDIYAYKELQALEAIGICKPGEAGLLTEEGYTLQMVCYCQRIWW
jgi:acetyl-CoA C-acetyltransferase